MSTIDKPTPRLTSLSHGGGCGCKIAPGVLAGLLKDMPAAAGFADLLVGRETSDDAAVYRINDDQAVVATTDFFMPIVDDPFDFGRIAAANALSDLYAMGATPLFALAIVGMPIQVLPADVIGDILRGGEAVCAQAGVPVAGGHSIDSVEPIYGLAAVGLVHPREVKRNTTARAGDVLVLGKPLGVGIHSAAFKQGVLDEAGYRALIETTTRLNRIGPELARLEGVHAMTDVTGFGLLGHLLEICRGSAVQAQVDLSQLPLLPQTRRLADAGCITGASSRNWQSYGEGVALPATASPTDRAILTDPQTSGGLLVTCAAEVADSVLARFVGAGFGAAAIIGRLAAGTANVSVR